MTQKISTFLLDPDELIIVGLDVEGGDVLDDERLSLPLEATLVDSITRYGVKKNVIVRKNLASGKLEVVDGRQRVRCARKANELLAQKGERSILVPVVLEEGSDDLMFELQITLNTHIQSTPLMRARLAERYLARSRDKVETARICGVSIQTLDNWLALLQTTEEVQQAVEEGKISSNLAKDLAKVARSQQGEALEKLISMGASKKGRKKRSTERDSDKPALTPPSKALLLGIVTKYTSGECDLDEQFILGLKYALGMVLAKEVPGLNEVVKKK